MNYPRRTLDPALAGDIVRTFTRLKGEDYVSACILSVLADRKVTIAKLVSEDTLFSGRSGEYRNTIQKSMLDKLSFHLSLIDHEGYTCLLGWVDVYERHGVDIVTDMIRANKTSRFLVKESAIG
jgi:hypothetical protein